MRYGSVKFSADASAIRAVAAPLSRRSRRALFGLFAAALLPMVGCSSSQNTGQQSLNGVRPDGTIRMEQVQAAFIGSGGGGSGTLYYRGQTYPFAVGGLGIGGIGASTINAEGEVYGLKRIEEPTPRAAMGSLSATRAPATCG